MMLRRYLRRAALASAVMLGLAAFAYSPYAFPQLLDGEALALAYRVRYLFLMATLWLLGPAASFPAFVAKVALIALVLGLLLGAALLPLGVRREKLHRAGDAQVDRP
jgi:hypothetical protein